jgi:hypothetical protein
MHMAMTPLQDLKWFEEVCDAVKESFHSQEENKMEKKRTDFSALGTLCHLHEPSASMIRSVAKYSTKNIVLKRRAWIFAYHTFIQSMEIIERNFVQKWEYLAIQRVEHGMACPISDCGATISLTALSEL